MRFTSFELSFLVAADSIFGVKGMPLSLMIACVHVIGRTTPYPPELRAARTRT